MPQLVKGGKWTYGWVLVGMDRLIIIPPQAWQEYGFRAGDEAIFFSGSRRSGGFALSYPARIVRSKIPLDSRIIARGVFGEGSTLLPPEINVQPGTCLLVVRGSGLALGMIEKGPIFEEALKHPDLFIFGQAA